MTDPSEDTVLSHKSDQISPPRKLVESHYRELLEEQSTSADKAFIGGHSLSLLDPNLIALEEDAHEHPRTWTFRSKAIATGIVATFCFLSPFASTIFAPSIDVIAKDLGIHDSTLAALEVSIFLFAFGVGPLFLAPLSEIYGRVVILQLGNLVFLAFSLGSGFAQTPAQLAVMRFFTGLGGSSGLAVVGGMVFDLWDIELRPKASGLVMLGPVLGPVLGPLCGGWMTQGASWRWTVWIPAIASGVLSVVAAFFLHETYAPRVLRVKLQQAQKANPDQPLYTVLDLDEQPTSAGFLLTQTIRPVIYLLVDPALFLSALYYSIVFGITYLVIVTYSEVFQGGYHHSVGIVGTDFIALGIGMIVGTFATVKAIDVIFKRGGKDAISKFTPESRLWSSFVGAFVTSVGLFIYGFSAMKTHFIVPLIGAAIFTAGVTNIMVSIQLYVVEGFDYPASAFAAITVVRCIFAGAFPLFGPKLFKSLGVDWGVGLLAFIALGTGVGFVICMHMFGKRFREQGKKNMAKFTGSHVKQ